MPFCSKCGQSHMEGVKFCPGCGAAVGGPSASDLPGANAAAPPAAAAPAPALSENVAGLLCYTLGWLTGIIFFVVDKRPFVRFHAAQSMVAFFILQIAHWVVTGFLGFAMWSGD